MVAIHMLCSKMSIYENISIVTLYSLLYFVLTCVVRHTKMECTIPTMLGCFSTGTLADGGMMKLVVVQNKHRTWKSL